MRHNHHAYVCIHLPPPPPVPTQEAAWALARPRTSREPIARIICQMPAPGTLDAAVSGSSAASEAKEMPAEVESMPSKWVPVAVHAQPTHASIATRQCFSSAARTRLRLLSSMFLDSSSGSHTLPLISSEAPTSCSTPIRGAALRCATADRLTSPALYDSVDTNTDNIPPATLAVGAIWPRNYS